VGKGDKATEKKLPSTEDVPIDADSSSGVSDISLIDDKVIAEAGKGKKKAGKESKKTAKLSSKKMSKKATNLPDDSEDGGDSSMSADKASKSSEDKLPDSGATEIKTKADKENRKTAAASRKKTIDGGLVRLKKYLSVAGMRTEKQPLRVRRKRSMAA